MKWPGAIQVDKATDYTMIGNSIAGSEKLGYLTTGVKCDDYTENVKDNEVYCVHYHY